MKRWLRRVRGTLGMGATWAFTWAVGGLLIRALSNVTPFVPWHYFFAIWDAPLPALAVPGFVAGVIFASVLGVAGAQRRFNELSLPRVGAWGALGGILVALIPDAMVAAGMAHLGDGGEPWKLTLIIAGPLVALSTLSACASLLVARMGVDDHDADPGEPPPDALGPGDVYTVSPSQRMRERG